MPPFSAVTSRKMALMDFLVKNTHPNFSLILIQICFYNKYSDNGVRNVILLLRKPLKNTKPSLTIDYFRLKMILDGAQRHIFDEKSVGYISFDLSLELEESSVIFRWFVASQGGAC